MRKLLISVAVVAAALVPTTAAFATTSAKSGPPVKISGKVNNEGTGTATGGNITIVQHDYSFTPTFVLIPKGVTTVTVTVTNMGQSLHSFTVPQANISADINPGSSMTFTLPAKATFFYCRFHRQLGMTGALFTKKGQKIATSPGSGSSTATTSGGSSGGYGY